MPWKEKVRNSSVSLSAEPGRRRWLRCTGFAGAFVPSQDLHFDRDQVQARSVWLFNPQGWLGQWQLIIRGNLMLETLWFTEDLLHTT